MSRDIFSRNEIVPRWWVRRPADYYIRESDAEMPRVFLKSEDAKALDSVALTSRLERLNGPARVSEAEKAQAQIVAVLMAETGNRFRVSDVLRAFAGAGGVTLREDSFPACYFVILRNIWLLHVRSDEGLVQAVNDMGLRSAPAI